MPSLLPDAPHSQFAAYATGAAFRIDLTKRMIQGLMHCASGRQFDTGYYGAIGLINRGLVEIADRQEGKYAKLLRITPAGQKVAELCELAGLGDIAKEG